VPRAPASDPRHAVRRQDAARAPPRLGPFSSRACAFKVKPPRPLHALRL
jgi:hypothetical protein